MKIVTILLIVISGLVTGCIVAEPQYRGDGRADRENVRGERDRDNARGERDRDENRQDRRQDEPRRY